MTTLDLSPLAPSERSAAIRAACVPGVGTVRLTPGNYEMAGPAIVDSCTLDLAGSELTWHDQSATLELRGAAGLCDGWVVGGQAGPGIRVSGQSAQIHGVVASGLYALVCAVDSAITIDDSDLAGAVQGLLWHGPAVAVGSLLLRGSTVSALAANGGAPRHALYLGEQIDARVDRCRLISPAWAVQLGVTDAGADNGTRAGSAQITRCDLTDAGQGIYGATRYRARVERCRFGGQALAVRAGGLLVLDSEHAGEILAQDVGGSPGELVLRRCRTEPGGSSLSVLAHEWSGGPAWDVADLVVDWSGDREVDACASDYLVRGEGLSLRMARTRITGATRDVYTSRIVGTGHDLVLEDVDGEVHGRLADLGEGSRLRLRGRVPRGRFEPDGYQTRISWEWR